MLFSSWEGDLIKVSLAFSQFFVSVFVKNLSVSWAVWQVTRSHFCYLSVCVSSELVWVVWWLVLEKWSWRKRMGCIFFHTKCYFVFVIDDRFAEKERKNVWADFVWVRERERSDQISPDQLPLTSLSSGDRFLIFCFDMNAEDIWLAWGAAEVFALCSGHMLPLPPQSCFHCLYLFICCLQWQFI